MQPAFGKLRLPQPLMRALEGFEFQANINQHNIGTKRYRKWSEEHG